MPARLLELVYQTAFLYCPANLLGYRNRNRSFSRAGLWAKGYGGGFCNRGSRACSRGSSWHKHRHTYGLVSRNYPSLDGRPRRCGKPGNGIFPALCSFDAINCNERRNYRNFSVAERHKDADDNHDRGSSLQHLDRIFFWSLE